MGRVQTWGASTVFGAGIQNFIWLAEFSTLRLWYDRLDRGCVG